MGTKQVLVIPAYKKNTSTTEIDIISEKKKIGEHGTRKWTQEVSFVAFLICNKIDFIQNLIKRDKQAYLILIKLKIHQTYVAIHNIYAPNARVNTFVKESLVINIAQY